MMYRVVIFILLPLASMLAQTPSDTIKLSGRCEYIGRTYSITFACYYRIKIDKVLQGEYKDDYIVVEADIDSGTRYMQSKTRKETEVDVAQKSALFGLEFIPISRVFKCKGEKITIRVRRDADPIRPDIVRYFMVSETDPED